MLSCREAGQIGDQHSEISIGVSDDHLYQLVNWALDKLLEVIPQISDSYKDTSIDIQSANNLV